jgi:hypothetical protein
MVLIVADRGLIAWLHPAAAGCMVGFALFITSAGSGWCLVWASAGHRFAAAGAVKARWDGMPAILAERLHRWLRTHVSRGGPKGSLGCPDHPRSRSRMGPCNQSAIGGSDDQGHATRHDMHGILTVILLLLLIDHPSRTGYCG